MRGLGAIIAIALLLAACGSSSTTSTHAASAPASPATSSTATRTQPPPGKTVTVTATAPVPAPVSAGNGACVASELTLSFLGGQGATGHGLLGFELKNTSAHACRTYGYPGILFLGQTGQALPTIPTHTTQDFFGSAPLAKLLVGPGAVVSFRLGVTHGAASPAGCTTAYGLQVIPPDDTATLRTSIPGGAYECRTATVSPLQSGTRAYP